MKTILVLVIFLTLCSCGGGGGNHSSSRTVSPSTSGETQNDPVEIAHKAQAYEKIWNDIHADKFSPWNSDPITDLSLQLGIEIGKYSTGYSWKELKLLGDEFLDVKSSYQRPNFEYIAEKILTEIKK